MYFLVCIIYGKEVTEVSVIQSKLKDTFNQEESEQIYANEGNDHVNANAEVTTNITSIVSTNVTKVNCSLEKIHGPVEVLQEIAFYY